jgi:hypothetical protein
MVEGVTGFEKPLVFEAFNAAIGLVGMSLEHPGDIKGMLDEHHQHPDLIDAFKQVVLFQEAVLLGDKALGVFLDESRRRGDAIAGFSEEQISMLRQVVIDDFKCYMARRTPADLAESILAYRTVLGLAKEAQDPGLNGQSIQ